VQTELNSNSPLKQAFKRLRKNRMATIGFYLALIAHVIAFLGYLIMPDQTPNADDGSHSIKKLSPLSEVTLLKVHKHREINKVSFITKLFIGQESEYIIEPIDTFYFKGDSVFYRPYKEKQWDKIDLLYAYKPLYSGYTSVLSKNGLLKKKTKDSVFFVDYKNVLHSNTITELQNKFIDSNIEKRFYFLGTDKKGRDILSRLIFGTRISLSIGFISVAISLLVGITLGSIAGFFGGYFDKFLMWVLTITWSIPGIMLVIAISLALQSKGIWVAFVAVGLTMWVEVARVVRGQIISIKEKQYIESAKAFGIRNGRVIFYHILPNMVGPLIVIATSNFASAILIESGLSFLGLGVQPPMPSWGMMVSEGYSSNWSDGGWYLVFFPSICISMLVLAFNLLGNGLRDAIDPKSNTKW
jgi:ABC-type dipeptide/oligopeptide/nickel transport system permease subunit